MPDSFVAPATVFVPFYAIVPALVGGSAVWAADLALRHLARSREARRAACPYR